MKSTGCFAGEIQECKAGASDAVRKDGNFLEEPAFKLRATGGAGELGGEEYFRQRNTQGRGGLDKLRVGNSAVQCKGRRWAAWEPWSGVWSLESTVCNPGRSVNRHPRPKDSVPR